MKVKYMKVVLEAGADVALSVEVDFPRRVSGSASTPIWPRPTTDRYGNEVDAKEWAHLFTTQIQ